MISTVLEQVSGFATEFVTVKSKNHLKMRMMGKRKVVADVPADI